MAGPRRSSRQPRPPGLLDAGPLEPDIASFRLQLAAKGKAARTVQGYTSSVRWFASREHLPGGRLQQPSSRASTLLTRCSPCL